MNINSRTSKINFTGFASGAIASFTGLRAAPIIVRSQINAIQQGSGDPAPDNIRPIIGRDSITITANSVDHEIDLGDTYYGGSLNVTTGVLTVDNGIVDMGTLNWVYDSSYNRFNTTYSLIKPSGQARTAKIMCSVLTPITDGRPVSQVTNNSIYQGTGYSISAHDNRFTDATLFTNAVTGQTIVYPLATPITVQLTPEEIWQAIGSNSISSDAGNVEVYYVTI